MYSDTHEINRDKMFQDLGTTVITIYQRIVEFFPAGSLEICFGRPAEGERRDHPADSAPFFCIRQRGTLSGKKTLFVILRGCFSGYQPNWNGVIFFDIYSKNAKARETIQEEVDRYAKKYNLPLVKIGFKPNGEK